MTKLRRRMIEDMEIRNLSPNCFRQLDLAHFDALNWPTPGTSIAVPQPVRVRW
jgi:hypothetical protein